jgi:hypothetical protein
MRALAAVAAALVILAAVPGAARAEYGRRQLRPVPSSAEAAQADAAAPPMVWYGKPLVIVDGVAFAAFVGGMVAGDSMPAGAAVGAGGLSLVVMGPMVHFSHQHGARGLGSLVLRTGAVAFAGLISLKPFCAGGKDCDADGWNVAGAATLLGVLFLDDFVLANEAAPARGRVWSPTVAPVPGGGATLGLAGTF